ncbi:hypothetical protein BJ166DRAFT_496397 [Pestalotiopsis sp. NC0098]|nr:hypothetical protein BJ166DRAFT_496397 [Pestalotiopsis sp. NC0098]
MARNRGNRSRNRNHGRSGSEGNGVRDNNSNNRWGRGGHTSVQHGSRHRQHGRHDSQNSHHYQNHQQNHHLHHAYRHQGHQRWNWQHDLDSEETDTTDSSESDMSDAGFIDPSRFPPAQNDVFSMLRPTALQNGHFVCLRADCGQTKKSLDWIRKRDRRLRRVLTMALEQIGPSIVAFLMEEDEEDDEEEEYDSDSMDWTPEPTVNLVMNVTPNLEALSPPNPGLGIFNGTSPYQPHLPLEQNPSSGQLVLPLGRAPVATPPQQQQQTFDLQHQQPLPPFYPPYQQSQQSYEQQQQYFQQHFQQLHTQGQDQPVYTSRARNLTSDPY